MAKQVNFSVVITVLNEEQSIVPLLDSLFSQVLLPKEIIIVDAGSSDNTLQLIDEYKKQHKKISINVFEKKGIFRSAGRNLGISKATHNWVAVTDAGVICDKNWLKHFSEKILSYTKQNQKTELLSVAGFYHISATNTWQEIFGWYIGVSPQDFNEQTFLPSSRSVAFTKQVWQKAGKYPEHLNTCEDLVFAKQLKDKTQMLIEKKAIVLWKMPSDMTSYLQTISGYVQGDVQAGYKPHIKKILIVWLRLFFFVSLPVLGLLFYLFYPQYKFKLRNEALKASRVEIAIVQLLTDLGIIVGSFKGFISKTTN